jgi:hypothetical protein
LTYERNSNDTILIRRLEHLVIDENKTLTQIIQEALDEYLEKGVIRVENKKRYDLRVICNIGEKLYMQSSNNRIILVSVILIISIATITLTLTNNIYALQENSNLNLTTTFTIYFSISTAAAEEDDDEDDISEYNRNADKKHEDDDD